MSKETLIIIITILIGMDVLREGYLKGFIRAFLKNLIRYKKTTLLGIMITIFSIVYLDLPVAKQFSNKYYEKTLQGIKNGARIATPEELVILKRKVEIEKINKDKYLKYEIFCADQGDGDTTAGTIVLLLLIGTLFKNKKLRKVSKEALMTIIVSGLLVNILKYIISRLRPDVNMLPYQFFNWASWINGNQSINPFKSASASFPSGHSIVSVAVAFSFYYGYKNKFIRLLAITYALILSLSRVYSTRHWLSDIILATFLGVLIAKTVCEINKNKK